MPVRSYKVLVNFVSSDGHGTKRTSQMHMNANGQELSDFLKILDESPNVTDFSVFNTIVMPNLYSYGRLTAEDLCNIDLKKLK